MKVTLVTAPTLEPVAVWEAKDHLYVTDMDNDELIADMLKAAREEVEDRTNRKLISQVWEYYLDDWPEDDYIVLPFGNLTSVTSVKWKDEDGVETNLTKSLTAFAASDVTPLTKTKVTSAAHGYSDGDLVFISGTTSYDGGWTISNVATNTFDITMVYVADDATGEVSTYYIVETNGGQHGQVILGPDSTWPTDTLFPSNPIVIQFTCGWTSPALVPSKIKAAIKMLTASMFEDRGENIVGSGLTVTENKTVDRLLASERLWWTL